MLTINKPNFLKHIRIASAIIALAALPLGGCTIAAIGGATYYGLLNKEQETNFIAVHYAVADYMIHQAETYIERREDLIIARPIIDTNQPGMSSLVSRMIPERIGIRLAQLGYRLDLSQVKASADTNYLKPQMYKGETPDFMLSGTYTRYEEELAVHMRITNTRSGKIVSTYDYTMPMTREMDALSRAKPQITRMSGQNLPPDQYSSDKAQQAYRDYRNAGAK